FKQRPTAPKDNDINLKIVRSVNLKQKGNSIHKKALVYLYELDHNIRSTIGAFERMNYEKKLSKKNKN
ncbi:MAG: hypothetical protein KAH18_13470, partial [Psychromonas sp.]|nr:hypothetical protein [Psychromonas sp.]